MKKKPAPQRIHEKTPIGVGTVACIYKSTRSPFWIYRHWITSEKRYLRLSLGTIELREAQILGEKKFLEVTGVIHSGEKIFSLTAQEQVDKYLEYQQSRMKQSLSYGQFKKYRNVIGNHYLEFVKPTTLIQNIKPNFFVGYVTFRQTQSPPPTLLTIKQEQQLISALWEWTRQEQFVSPTMIPRFAEFKIASTDGKRAHFNETIYNQIVNISKNWHKHTTNEEESYNRQIVHLTILGCAWYGWRTGEALGLKWKDVQLQADGTAVVVLPAEITKTKYSRLNKSRGDIFERILAFTRHNDPNDYIFAPYVSKRTFQSQQSFFYNHFTKLKEVIQAKYPDFDAPNVDPYHFRHFYITCRLLAGDSPYDIASLCGTSLKMIEHHYDHMRHLQIAEKVLSKKLSFNKDGTVTVTEVKQEGAKP